MDKECIFCGTMMYGVRKSRQYCSNSCTQKAAWKRNHPEEDKIKKCGKCGKDFKPHTFGTTRKYCFDCVPDSAYKDGASVRRLIKQWALEYKGSKCSCCGYDNCIEALDFHHLNQEEKEFHLSDRNIRLDWEAIRVELDKCILVCSNCHREIHAGVREV